MLFNLSSLILLFLVSINNSALIYQISPSYLYSTYIFLKKVIISTYFYLNK